MWLDARQFKITGHTDDRQPVIDKLLSLSGAIHLGQLTSGYGPENTNHWRSVASRADRLSLIPPPVFEGGRTQHYIIGRPFVRGLLRLQGLRKDPRCGARTSPIQFRRSEKPRWGGEQDRERMEESEAAIGALEARCAR
jgi:hypothetical protein